MVMIISLYTLQDHLFYGISNGGISFSFGSHYIIIYSFPSINDSQLIVTGDDFYYGPTTVTVTVFPPNYYILTINTNPIITKYIAVEFNQVVGVYDSIAYINDPLHNRVDSIGSFYNDNILDYTAGAPYYGITDAGISYSDGGESVNIYNPYTGEPLYLEAVGSTTYYTTVIATVTPIPIQYPYYKLDTTSCILYSSHIYTNNRCICIAR